MVRSSIFISDLDCRPKKLKATEMRCSWCEKDSLYVEYHDKEWGVPVYDDQVLFEFIVLETAQAGLSWLTILKKRENYRKAFHNFDPRKIKNMKSKDVSRLMKNEGIIRNEKKIVSVIENAKAFINIQQEYGSFQKYMWRWVKEKPIQNRWKNLKEIPATTPLSIEISKDLKKRGFKFLGPTIVYAHLQATGLINDHLVGCFRYKEVKALRQK